MKQVLVGVGLLILLGLACRIPITVSVVRNAEEKMCFAHQQILASLIEEYNLQNPSSPLKRFEGEKTQQFLIEKGFLKGKIILRCNRQRRDRHGIWIEPIVSWFSPLFEEIPDNYVHPIPIGSGEIRIPCKLHGDPNNTDRR